MGTYKEVEGNLITNASKGEYDVIAHGCNCFCTMSKGLAPQMAKAFGCDEYYYEHKRYYGDISKLGNIDYRTFKYEKFKLSVVNCYTQYSYDVSIKPLDYEALILCFRKMNFTFKGQHIGLPQIGCHLAGGDWEVVKKLIQKEFKDCKVTVVIFNNKSN